MSILTNLTCLVDAKPILEPPGIQGHDQLPAHQEPLHQVSHADQPFLHHARRSLAGYPSFRQGSACREGCAKAVDGVL